jgi:S-adenosylmethionine decarboxylase proenzyme
VIAESHLSIHTWPEYNFASIDIYTCGSTVNPWKAFDYLKKHFKAANVTAMEMKRGFLNKRNIKVKGGK